MRGWSTLGMPIPVSETVNSTSSPSDEAETVILPPEGVYCTALSSKFCKTSARRRRSAAISGRDVFRSEEHTSELQSQSNLVCRLLLETKKRFVLTWLRR